jgi:nucleotide-binding universal stress UspA family protein
LVKAKVIKVSELIKHVCIKRILVSLDSSRHSFSALKAAVELARHYDAKLKGVFIQDTALIKLAETEFFYEVGEYTAISRRISVEGITHGMAVQSRWIANAFQKLTVQTGIDGDFLVLHGDVDEIIERESKKFDLLVIGKSGTHPMKKSRLGSTAKAIIQRGGKSILLVEEDTNIGYPIFVLFEDSPLGWISLQTASDLLSSGEKMTILIEEVDPEELANQKQKIRTWAKEEKVNISFQSFKAETFGRFILKIKSLRTGLFFVPFMQKPLYKELVEKYLKEIPFPIFIVQQPINKDESKGH